ncbi:MAG: hypothetical protein KDD45_10000, partial [Bdellovibrionales bacterium]|nr:hypothetical protein [Bdellovibrionales bacterium]
VYIVLTPSRIKGLSHRTGEILFGNLTLLERLESQLLKLNVSFKKISFEQLSTLKGETVFFDDIFYSENLIQKLITEKWVFSDKESGAIEGKFNSAICFDNIQSISIFFGLTHAKKNDIEQQSLMKIPLKLPESIYPEKNYHVALPNIYCQKILDWPDLLKAQSLFAREIIINSVRIWKTIFGEFLLNKLMNHPFLAKRNNRIGKNCQIHPTAILESCVIGDNVEIGPYCYLRGAIIGDDVVIQEHSSIKLSTIGKGTYILPCQIFNCLIGKEVLITTHILFHCVVGDSTFIGGGVGFADLNASRKNISVSVGKATQSSDQMFLGSMIGEHGFIGAGLLFNSGQRIPHHSTFLNYQMIQKADLKEDQIYVAQGSRVTQSPKQFLKESKKL